MTQMDDTQIQDTQNTEKPSNPSSKITVFPIARMKRLIKAVSDQSVVSQDAVLAISVASELFIKNFATQASTIAQSEKRKTIFYKDLVKLSRNVERFEFLNDVLPETIPELYVVQKKIKTNDTKEIHKGEDFKEPSENDHESNPEGLKPDDDNDDVDELMESRENDHESIPEGTGIHPHENHEASEINKSN
ncbi:Histone-fold domain-containing protein [Rozella allomycis CSF55]|uniref:Histone-fold domain-containing protein n=1 Tax=Rozella allomycis (strain CSF55) TaxID=988480 RepID=A0A075B3B7_ROZAC|nr:Histone-fold domain-containing protein [Rozella allomycis CSF55]|eukprot:EPZ35461.1 Histone-fold domain-containing protein [Rozella allomycis CSF55]